MLATLSGSVDQELLLRNEYLVTENRIRSVKTELLSKMILFGEGSLRHCLDNYVNHFHAERNHQGKGNVMLCCFHRSRIGSVKYRGTNTHAPGCFSAGVMSLPSLQSLCSFALAAPVRGLNHRRPANRMKSVSFV